MLLPEQMGWTFHRVCIKEASTWMLPLEMDKCCRGDAVKTGSVYFAAVAMQVELRDEMMETAAHLETLSNYTFTCTDWARTAADPINLPSGVQVCSRLLPTGCTCQSVQPQNKSEPSVINVNPKKMEM